MPLEPKLIANPRVGMERDLEPWLLPHSAYPDLEDCYLWRGRIKKRDGYTLLGQLNRSIGTTDGSGNATITLTNIPLTAGLSRFAVGVNSYIDPGGASPVTLLVNGSGTATLNRSTGVLQINGSTATLPVLYYPGLPVMGLVSQESTTTNVTSSVAFDTSFAYTYNNNNSTFQDASFYKTTLNPINWSGTNSQLFWTTNYATALWATNFNIGFQSTPTASIAGRGDGIRWFDEDQSGWVNFLPQVDGTNFLMTALMIYPFKDRLVVLNTIEGTGINSGKTFPQRARWSQNGTPFYVAPTPSNYQGGTVTNAWRSDLVGFGGYIDAPTLEAIVSAEFVKDSLVVYFEKSTWQLRYTGNELLPFIWEKINTELGSISTFSVVPFDKVAIAISDVGIHACDSVDVNRIDDKIPDEVFQINIQNQGGQRVYGIRDYERELVYWSIPYRGYDTEIDIDNGTLVTFPNKLLVYNYKQDSTSFSFFNDSFTCFGYLQASEPSNKADLTWANANMTWQEANFLWIGLQNANTVRVIGGNQQGYVEILQDTTFNDVSLFISNITISGNTINIFCPNHNLPSETFVEILNPAGITGLLSTPYKITVPLIGSPLAPDPNNFTIQQAGVAGTYTGPGTIIVINNISIETKRFNPYISEGAQVRLEYVDFYVDTTESGQFTVNIYIDEDSTTPINAPASNNPNLATNIVNTFPESTYAASPDTILPNSKLWKRLYVEDISQLFQLQITLSDAQMMLPNVVQSDIVLHGMILWFSRSGRLINV